MNRKRVPLLIFFVIVLGLAVVLIFSWVFTSPDFRQGTVLWKGIYVTNFENSIFVPCRPFEWRLSDKRSPNEIWWAEGNLDEIFAVTNNLNDFTPVYIEFMGEVSSKGRFGYRESFSRKITIVDILKVQKVIPKDCH